MQELMLGWSGIFIYFGLAVLGFIALIFIDGWIRNEKW